MSKITKYFEESYNELVNKVTWPSWKDLQSSGIVVMVASFIIAIIIALMDYSFRNAMEVIYNSF
jgi:preprotein translocase subunit SecE